MMWKERLQAQLVKTACQSPVHHLSFSEDQSECVSAPALGQVSGFTLPTTMPCSRHGDKPRPSQLLAMQRCCPRALRQGLPAGACLTQGQGTVPPSLPSLLPSSFHLVRVRLLHHASCGGTYTTASQARCDKFLQIILGGAHHWVENWVPQPLEHQWREQHLPGLVSHHWESSSLQLTQEGKGMSCTHLLGSSLPQSLLVGQNPWLWGLTPLV